MSEKVFLQVKVEIVDNITMQTWKLVSPKKSEISENAKERIFDDVGVDIDTL